MGAAVVPGQRSAGELVIVAMHMSVASRRVVEPILAGEGTAPVRVALGCGGRAGVAATTSGSGRDLQSVWTGQCMERPRGVDGWTGSGGGRVVADLTTVRGSLAWSRDRLNLSAVDTALLPQARIGPRQAARMAWQLRRAAEACGPTPDGGVAVFAAGTVEPAASFACPDGPVPLLRDGRVQLWAESAGLRLRGSGLGRRGLRVMGWRVGAESVSVRTENGWLDLDPPGRLLTRVAPPIDEAQVRPVPLRAVFAGLLVDLADLAARAAAADAPLLIRHGPARWGR